MSRDTKYIGMDVHKEAIVIAVLNDSGKVVMESIGWCEAKHRVIDWASRSSFTEEFEIVIMINGVTEEMHGSN
jgi:hypothetical protein